ncbi:MAG TPA: type II toxin-antitoxin system PemK/MazF family toxin [Candidatus Limnocylindrales bacterium]|nr:type II toxin-antitoxin system PemK/MazF family toxin [Candidatus Limnocylindrales bacterium]
MSIGQRPVLDRGRRGDIHLVTFEDIGGAAIQGPHPAVIVQSERLARSSTVLVCPMTTRQGRGHEVVPPYLVWVSRQATGLDRDGWVKADQLYTRPVELLGPRLGHISPEAMTRVDASLRFVLAL